jgi:hypothetical protein
LAVIFAPTAIYLYWRQSLPQRDAGLLTGLPRSKRPRRHSKARQAIEIEKADQVQVVIRRHVFLMVRPSIRASSTNADSNAKTGRAPARPASQIGSSESPEGKFLIAILRQTRRCNRDRPLTSSRLCLGLDSSRVPLSLMSAARELRCLLRALDGLPPNGPATTSLSALPKGR